MKKSKDKKFSFNRLFYNNRFIMIFSVIASVILWFVVSSSPDNQQRFYIHDVPVTVNLSETAKANNLKVFSQSVEKVTVTVQGNMLSLVSLSSGDIAVTAQGADSIVEARTYNLLLAATKQSMRSSYEIEGVEPKTVTVMVDEEVEKEFTVEDGTAYKVAEDYYASSAKYSLAKVKLNGPKSEMDRVSKVKVVYQFDGELTETQKATAKLTLYDNNNDVIDSKYITRTDTGNLLSNDDKVEIELVVLPKKEIPLKVAFLNKPAGFSTSTRITIEPSSLLLAGTEEQFDHIEKGQLIDSIDFSTLNPDTKQIVSMINLPQGVENLSNYREATIKIDMSGMSSKTVEVPVADVLTFSNLSGDKEAKCLTSTLTVTIVGPTDLLEAFTEANILAAVDLADKPDMTGHAELPVKLSITGDTNCWIYGSDYKVSVEIKEKGAE